MRKNPISRRSPIVRRRLALLGKGLNKRLRRPALPDQGELPGQVLGVLNAAVEATRPERRDLVRGVAAIHAVDLGQHAGDAAEQPVIGIGRRRVGHVERRDIGRQALQEQNYSVLLADVTKLVIEVIDPDQASEAIARAFRWQELIQNGTYARMRVLMATGGREPASIVRALAAGADEYTMKPFTADAIAEKLRMVGVLS